MWRDAPRDVKIVYCLMVILFLVLIGPVKGLFLRWWDETALQDFVIMIAYWIVAGVVVFLLGEYAYWQTYCELHKHKGRNRLSYLRLKGQIVLSFQLFLFLALIGPIKEFLFDRLPDTWFPEFMVTVAYWIVAVSVIGFLPLMVVRKRRGLS